MKMTIKYDPDSRLIEIESSGGTLGITQTEAAALYTLLKKALGFRGRLKLWMNRRMFSQVSPE